MACLSLPTFSVDSPMRGRIRYNINQVSLAAVTGCPRLFVGQHGGRCFFQVGIAIPFCNTYPKRYTVMETRPSSTKTGIFILLEYIN